MLVRRCVVQCFPGSIIEAGGRGDEVVLGESYERGTFGKILAQPAIGVFIGAALPGSVLIGIDSLSSAQGAMMEFG